MRRRSTFLTMIVLLMASAGCGTSDQERVEGALREWLVVNLENDHERVCALMTAEYRGERTSRTASLEDCLTEERRHATPATPSQRRAVADVEIVNVEIDGDTATAFLRRGDCTLRHTGTELRRVDGEWRYGGSIPTPGLTPRCLE
jgi:hypothetical protein